MQTATSFKDLRRQRAEFEPSVGLVPTMGYLHEGHLSLARRARNECSSVVATIFVNPTQFGPGEDLEAYPRDIPHDLELLEAAGVDLVWTPSAEPMYPAGYQTWVTVEDVTLPLEGGMRPGHFRGVTTVVAKLFNAVQPHRAYFGQKDAQQAVVIRRMVRDLNYPIEIVVCPIVREADGLAMSSRNVYLDPAQRKAATVLHRALSAARDAFVSDVRDAEKLRRILTETVNREPLARLEYVSCSHPEQLVELEGEVSKALLSMAVYFGNTRLIDNLVIGE